jgi:hypothetical protein
MESQRYQESTYESNNNSEVDVTLESESDQSLDLIVEFEHDDLIISYEENIHWSTPTLEPEILNAAETDTGE